MADQDKNETPNDRRDVLKQGSSLSGSTERNNTVTEAAVHPNEQLSRESDVAEVVDQDPGERQKENQNDQKDDPLAA